VLDNGQNSLYRRELNWRVADACHLDQARSLVRTTCSGFVTLDEVLAHFAELENDRGWRTGMLDVLLDLRSMTSTPETVELRQIAHRIARTQSALQFGACAIVASDPGQVGMGKVFAAFARAEFRATTVVTTIEEAEQWLRQV